MTVGIDEAVRLEILHLRKVGHPYLDIAKMVGLGYSKVRAEISRAVEDKLVNYGWTIKQASDEFRIDEGKVRELLDNRRISRDEMWYKKQVARAVRLGLPVPEERVFVPKPREIRWPGEPKTKARPESLPWDGVKDEIDDEVQREILRLRRVGWGYARIGKRVGFSGYDVKAAVMAVVEQKLVREGWSMQKVDDEFRIYATDIWAMTKGWTDSDMADEFAENRRKVMASVGVPQGWQQ